MSVAISSTYTLYDPPPGPPASLGTAGLERCVGDSESDEMVDFV